MTDWISFSYAVKISILQVQKEFKNKEQLLEYLDQLAIENNSDCPSLVEDMNKVYALGAQIERTLLGQVWELGTQIRLRELYDVGVDLNRFKEQYKKYENFQEQLRMTGIFAVYKPVLSQIAEANHQKLQKEEEIKDKKEAEAAAQRDKVFHNQLDQLQKLLQQDVLKEEREKREALEEAVEEMRLMIFDMQARYDKEIRELKARVEKAESQEGPYQG